jgi:ribose transport system ATP-binding protein
VNGVAGSSVSKVDLTVRRGEVIGIAGLSGSGREDLCGLIFGSLDRSGAVHVNGQAVPSRQPEMAVLHGLAYVPSNRHLEGLVMSMTVRENLTLVDLSRFWRRGRLHQRKERQDAVDWIDRLGIRGASESLVENLSGGNQQKVVLGKWLRVAPTVLLLNEPTQGIDIAAKADTHRLIAEAAHAGAAVIVSSSDEEELALLSNRVLIMHTGAVRVELSGQAVSAARICRECLITPEETSNRGELS